MLQLSTALQLFCKPLWLIHYLWTFCYLNVIYFLRLENYLGQKKIELEVFGDSHTL